MAIRVHAPEATTAPAALPGATQVVNPPMVLGGVQTPPKVDYKAEARREIEGKVRMNCIVAALQSPAGPAFAPTAEAYLILVKTLADMAFEYTFQGEGK